MTSTTPAVPFRTEIRTSSGLVSMEDARRLLTEIPDLSFTDAAQHPDEFVAWLVAHRLLREPSESLADYAERTQQRLKMTAPLVDRALRDADREGVVWTPLLDVLAETFDWVQLSRSRVKRADDSPFPDPHKWAAAALREWIRTRNDPKEFKPLLAYRSDAIRCALAAKARVFDESLIEHLAASASSAAVALKNEAVPASFRTRAAFASYDRLRNMILSVNDEGVREIRRSRSLALDESKLLRSCARTGLPASLRKRMEEDLDAQDPDWDLVCAVLARDPNTSRRVIKAIVRHASISVKAGALMHPNSDLDLIRQTFEEASTPQLLASSILYTRSPQINTDVLNILLDYCIDDVRILQSIAIHPAATHDIRRKIVQLHRNTELFEVLTFHPPALSDPVVRAALATSRSRAVLSRLLEHATPEEYPKFLSRLAQVSIEEAISVLRRTPPPEGTVFPEKLVARLLRAPRVEDRLTVLTQIVGRVNTVSTASPQETRTRKRKP